MQQRLKPTARSARAEIVATYLLCQLYVAMHQSIAAFHAGFLEGTTYAVCSRPRKLRNSSRVVLRAMTPSISSLRDAALAERGGQSKIARTLK